jgi:hypothetical protein
VSAEQGGFAVDEPTLQLLLTDALLLDAVDGLESIARRLIELYDRWNQSPAHAEDASLVGEVLADIGWWSGRFQGAVSTATAGALDGLASDGA